MTTLEMIDWIRKWWWLIGLVALAVLIWVKSGGQIVPDIEAEVNAAKATAAAKKLQARVGRERAKKQIEEQYAETINTLDETQKKEVKKLKQDPGARSRFYARLATKRARAKRT